MQHSNCPGCNASWPVFVRGHKVKVKGGYDENYIEDVCFNCGYSSGPYPARPIFIMDGRNKPKPVQKQEENTNDKKIEFTARKGDLELILKVGPDGFSKLLSMFRDD